MMRRRLFSLGGTAVYLHLATVLCGVYAVAVGHGLTTAIAFLSIILHETAHGLTAALFGQAPQEIELTPLGALMRLDDEQDLSPGIRLIVLFAGPVASFLLCWISILLTKTGVCSTVIGQRFFMCNLMLTMCNLLPALPLDGGRILALILGTRLARDTVKRIMQCIGTVIGLGCIGLNLYISLVHGGWNLSCAMAGCFFMYAGATCTTSAALAELRMFIDRKQRLESRGIMPCKWVAVTDNTLLRQALTRLAPCAHTVFLLAGTMDHAAPVFLGEDALIAAYLNDPTGSCRKLFADPERVDSD